jgi:hypothetical protein
MLLKNFQKNREKKHSNIYSRFMGRAPIDLDADLVIFLPRKLWYRHAHVDTDALPGAREQPEHREIS